MEEIRVQAQIVQQEAQAVCARKDNEITLLKDQLKNLQELLDSSVLDKGKNKKCDRVVELEGKYEGERKANECLREEKNKFEMRIEDLTTCLQKEKEFVSNLSQQLDRSNSSKDEYAQTLQKTRS